MKELVFIPIKQKRHKYPKVAEDGQILSATSPYYIYICINPECGCHGWIERWVSKVNNHKCPLCGKVMVRVANPKEVEHEKYPD